MKIPGGPVVESSPSSAAGVGSIPGRGAKIPHASWAKEQNIKQKRYHNKFNKDQKKKNQKLISCRQQTPIPQFLPKSTASILG